jgi:hypothetical protein
MVLEQEIPKFFVWIGPALLWFCFAGSLVAVFAAATAWLLNTARPSSSLGGSR